ncbi:TetR/AcrR family transcriptional regulator [Deinococcus maricopensis]|uniref:Regulatory protein TetR n=1 Tax=Deinococcus maricopensis (strain DSM 21211 / LMG 22137 / NRRL B-23946 / LB-34) TaxID=709986 RepID=E8U365_DEIML|nr:TetR/AcrR family transcriptional regulator [Deinococcus maricopensis]ADV66010.1 regulatory protein TetR [Deinococcus maricopensis DSM 21211]
MPSTVHRKRLPSADRRQQILQASADLFVERGFEAVTMGDIATALGISRPAIYSYFTSTEAILDVLLDERLHTLLDTIEPLLQDLLPQRPQPTIAETIFRHLIAERDTLTLLHSGGGPTFQARRNAFLNDLGHRVSLDPALLIKRHPHALLILTSLLDSLAFRAITDPTIDPDALAVTLSHFVRGGLGDLSAT